MNRNQNKQFNPRERARAKQASRDADERALASGRKSARQLHAENGLLAFPQDEVQIDYAGFIRSHQ
jgi:hypothetical protein